MKPAAWRYALKRTIHVFGIERGWDIAASLTFWSVLSAFPALLAIFGLFGVLGQGQRSAQSLISLAGDVLPKQTIQPLDSTIEHFASTGGASVGTILSLICALWSASRYVTAFSGALNRLYGVQEGRRFVPRRLIQFLITLAIVGLLAIVLFVLLLSRPLLEAPHAPWALGQVGLIVWAVLRWPLLAAAAVVIIVLLYWGTPNIKQPRLRWLSVGGVTALVLMALASLGFVAYVTHFQTFHREYGSVAGLVIFLVWLWLMNLVLLLGAGYDVELERARELRSGVDASERLQLPPRDDSRIRRLQRREERLRAEAMRLMR
ncbi:YihY/virulence factor BrkB family protein [Gryllotalpicola reticulitermitis]|uniref:YihY/virulence factor BrkB family protein n=1 Tax=Gryllotalpicola reticulitermitis TaxID=1184153 RepID=A0ABV8Q2D0_9MICO